MPSPSRLTSRARLPQTIGGFAASHWWCLIGIMLVGAALRLWHLGAWSLWVDEAHTWRDATMSLDGQYGFRQTERALYPLAFLTVRALLALGVLQPTEASLRLPFVWIGILTLPVLALCGRRLVGATPAVLAAAFLALDPWHIFWSQNARGYALVVLAAAVAINRAHAYAQQDRLRDLLATVLAVLFGALSHATAWLLVVGFVGFLGTRFLPDRRSARIRALLVTGLSALVLPWLGIVSGLFDGFVQSKSDPSLLHFLQTTAYYFRPTMLLAAVVALWLCRRLLDRTRALLLGCCGVLPFVALGIVGTEVVKVTARYAICTLPVVLWLAALAAVEVTTRLADSMPKSPRWARWACACLPVLMLADLAQGAALYHGEQFGQRSRWREACAFVQQRSQQLGRTGVRVATINEPTVLFYLRPRHWMFEPVEPYPTTEVIPLVGWTATSGLDIDKNKLHEPGAANHLAWHLEAARRQGRYLAFLVTMPELIEQDADGSLRRALTEQCRLVWHLPCWVGPKDESVYVYEPTEP